MPRADDRSMTAPAKDMIVGRVRSFPMFADLVGEDVDALAALMAYREFRKGSFIVAQHDSNSMMYLLLSGRVKVTLASPDGRELALHYLEAPAQFGEMSPLEDGARSADVIAITDAEVLMCATDDLAAAIQIQPRLALTLIGTQSRQLRQMIGRLEDMAFQDATHRVMRVLLNVATASYESRGVPVVEGLTHYEIATLAGTSRETASRVISNLGRDGILATKGRKIVVDLFSLSDYLERD